LRIVLAKVYSFVQNLILKSRLFVIVTRLDVLILVAQLLVFVSSLVIR